MWEQKKTLFVAFLSSARCQIFRSEKRGIMSKTTILIITFEKVYFWYENKHHGLHSDKSFSTTLHNNMAYQ